MFNQIGEGWINGNVIQAYNKAFGLRDEIGSYPNIELDTWDKKNKKILRR